MTLICATLIYQSGFSLIAPAIWLKTAVCGISVWNDLTFKRSIFYFYKNLGIHKKKLYIITFLSDFLLFILLIFMAFHLK